MRAAPAAALALALALAAAAAWPAAAGAGVLLPADAAELAQSLADAQAEQGVCYGWNVSNDFDGAPDVGSSNGGPGVALTLTGCPKYAVLTGNIHWACESCEDEDSAHVAIVTNITPAPGAREFEELGLEEDALVGDEDDTALANMIGALPLLVAQSGAAPPVPAETPAAVPPSDRPTDRPGPDFLREAWLRLVFLLALAGSGVWLWFYKRSQERAASRSRGARPKEA